MPYNITLANRVRELIADTGEERVQEKVMFGGLTFLVDEKICVGVKKDCILVRIDPAFYEQALEKEGVTAMSRDMKGYVFVNDEFLNSNRELKYWVKLALQFNPLAKASPRSSKKRAL